MMASDIDTAVASCSITATTTNTTTTTTTTTLAANDDDDDDGDVMRGLELSSPGEVPDDDYEVDMEEDDARLCIDLNRDTSPDVTADTVTDM